MSLHHYRPHPKDNGRLNFHFVFQSTPRWGVPTFPGLDGGGGTYLGQGGTYLSQGAGRVPPPSQVRSQEGGMGRKPPPPPPQPGQISRRGAGWVPPIQVRSQDGGKAGRVPPHPGQMELRGGRYASCVHAGGLSCYYCCLFG